MKFVHAADIHLDSPLRGLEPYDGAPVEQIRGAVRAAFEGLVELCLDEEVSFLVLSGDLYDGDWQDFNTGLYFVRQMVRLREGGVPVVVLHGNHDAQSRITRQLRLPENVHVFSSSHPETHTLDHLNVAFHGQSFHTQHVTENLAAGYPPPREGFLNIGVLHTALEGHSDHAAYAPCTVSELQSSGYDYWALGHVHQHTVVAESPHVVFPGNIQGRNIRETGPKGCCVVEVEDGRVLTVAHHPLYVVRWARLDVDVEDAESIEDVVQAASEPLAAAVATAEQRILAVRLSVSGQTELHHMLVLRADELTNNLRALATDVGAGAIYVEQVEVATRPLARRSAPSASLMDALNLIEHETEHLRTDTDGPDVILSQLRPLMERLPPALKSGSDRVSLDDPTQLDQLLRDAQVLAQAQLRPSNAEK